MVRDLACDNALIDGEAVVLRKNGRSDFLALMTKRGEAQASFGTAAPGGLSDALARAEQQSEKK